MPATGANVAPVQIARAPTAMAKNGSMNFALSRGRGTRPDNICLIASAWIWTDGLSGSKDASRKPPSAGAELPIIATAPFRRVVWACPVMKSTAEMVWWVF